jgi:hypothetical protein
MCPPCQFEPVKVRLTADASLEAILGTGKLLPRSRLSESPARRARSGAEGPLQEVRLALLAHDLVLEHVLQRLGATIEYCRAERYWRLSASFRRLIASASSSLSSLSGIGASVPVSRLAERLGMRRAAFPPLAYGYFGAG